MVETKAAYQSYLWGGDRMKTLFSKQDAPSPLAESWELSTHPDGMTTVQGERLTDYLKRTAGFSTLPVLVKLIDAAKPLSVQVHPTDAAAAPLGERGKTEAWHILAAEEGASLYLGVREPISKAAFLQKVQDGTVEEVLNRVPVRAGETYFVPAGVLHAIGKGIVLLEVQQSSNLTYRVYDYGRLDRDGNPRPLHVEQALSVAVLEPMEGTKPISRAKGQGKVLVDCPYFSLEAYSGEDRSFRFDSDDYRFLFVTEGAFSVCDGKEERSFRAGQGVLLVQGEHVTASGSGCIMSIQDGTV